MDEFATYITWFEIKFPFPLLTNILGCLLGSPAYLLYHLIYQLILAKKKYFRGKKKQNLLIALSELSFRVQRWKKNREDYYNLEPAIKLGVGFNEWNAC